jgi:hypothetical protein
MSNDERAIMILEKAVIKAKKDLEINQNFRPFAMILHTDGRIKIIENKIKDIEESYELLRNSMEIRVREDDIDIIALVIDTLIPERFKKGVSTGIRLHIEEKSQKNLQVSARYIYVPYELCKSFKSDEVFIKLYTPIPVGFPAEFIKKS